MEIMYTDVISSFSDLEKLVWSQALDVLHDVEERGMEKEFMQALEEYFSYSCETPSITEINDYIRNEWTEIFDTMGLYEDSKLKRSYPPMYELYKNLNDWGESFYEYEDLKSIFVGMSWDDITAYIDDFKYDFPNVADFISVIEDDEYRQVELDSDFVYWFY